ncbi:SpoIIE family protein phosphatase [Nonomuraea sp. MCN248]|uniref:SpoIIE family protein phosphatase n=1 Tax=Nonomuraea corallina TaxID=2989783 RepID=A0ABT4SLP4_9ACTN|nr:SpoIIE family protein phosphatase [Nonomuraea corallina]MDA0638157.1 SpoIIE family protein phosphatase [Nonomuraea corallina]
MTLISISILISCLSVMAVRGRRGPWPPGLPVARPRLSAAGGTYESSHGRRSDEYVIQERLIAVADGGGRGRPGHTAAALALGAVVAARPQMAGTRAEELGSCARTAWRTEPALAEEATGLDLIVLDVDEHPRLRYAHVGGGAIWHCAKGGRPRRLTAAGTGRTGTPAPEIGSVPLRQGDRVVVVTDGVVRALGLERLMTLFADGRSPTACLDQLYDELSVLDPVEDATMIVADFVSA